MRTPLIQRVGRLVRPHFQLGFLTVFSGLYLLVTNRYTYVRQWMLLLHAFASLAFLFLFLRFLNRHVRRATGKRWAGVASGFIGVFLIAQALGFHNSPPPVRIFVMLLPLLLFLLLTPRRIWKRAFAAIAALLGVVVVYGLVAARWSHYTTVPVITMVVFLPGFLLMNLAYFYARGRIPPLSAPLGGTANWGVILAVATNIILLFGLLLAPGSALAICGWLVGPIHGYGTLLWLLLFATHVGLANRFRSGTEQDSPPLWTQLRRTYAPAAWLALAILVLLPYLLSKEPHASNASAAPRLPMPKPEAGAAVRWTTTDGLRPEPERFQDSDLCGSCHEDIHREWKVSGHAHAVRSKGFQKLLALAKEDLGENAEELCYSCHAPLAVLLGPNAPLKQRQKAIEAAISCGVCHETVGATAPIGNGSYELQIRTPFLYAFSSDYHRVTSLLYRMATGEHIGRYGGNFLRTAESCAGCHVQTQGCPSSSLPCVPFMVQDSYTSWKNGPLGPGTKNTTACQKCHMPYLALSQVTRYQRDHRFFGRHWLRAEALGDSDTVEHTKMWLRGDLKGIEERSRMNFVKYFVETYRDIPPEQAVERANALYVGEKRSGGYRVWPSEDVFPGGPYFTVKPALQCTGEGRCKASVTTENRSVSHDFPTGGLSAVENWLEVTVKTCSGETVFTSGLLEPGGTLGSDAHRFGGTPIDNEGARVAEQRFWKATAWKDFRLLTPGKPVRDEYEFTLSPSTVPAIGGGCPLQVNVRLLYRSPGRRAVDELLGPGVPAPAVVCLAEGTVSGGNGLPDEPPAGGTVAQSPPSDR